MNYKVKRELKVEIYFKTNNVNKKNKSLEKHNINFYNF